MFNINEFKKQVKEWVESHSNADVADLRDYCEELIPPKNFAANQWLVEQTVCWYQYTLAQKEIHSQFEEDD